ncbi:hypothetical protein OJ997_11290 [Solirubrobacter phytolaccae]|uniref:Right handed beta helix domain-containing protein n=1 Tax=Solirubrobacter phytolaccae TaxID=1404360 RepID=A0A9X3N9F8_9ACTN|nr:hypothetical protein [Solirubrobacter phytolaccae]MDA0180879.1 hypothetical protein [Solirubrobacter phytolaccae]
MRRCLTTLLLAGALSGCASGGDRAADPTAPAAHVWVAQGDCDTTPSRARVMTTLAASGSAKACSVEQAWAVAEAGDTIRVACGTYGWQGASGPKQRETKVIGEPGCVRFVGTHECEQVFGAISVFCVLDADHLTLARVTLDSEDVSGLSSCFRVPSGSTDVTVKDLKCHGDQPFVAVNAPGFKWLGGEIGEDDDGLPRTTCSEGGGEPLWLFDEADGAVIDGVVFRKRLIQQTPTPDLPGCGENDGLPHLESIRLEDTDDVTVRNSVFKPGSDAGSGHLFSSKVPDRLTLIGNTFGRVRGSYSMQVPAAPDNWTVLRNTFAQPPLVGSAGGRWEHNRGLARP